MVLLVQPLLSLTVLRVTGIAHSKKFALYQIFILNEVSEMILCRVQSDTKVIVKSWVSFGLNTIK